jgi:hypothetical protein
LTKIFLKKIITQKKTQKKEKKNLVGKHYNKPQCFMRKAIMFSPHDLALLVIVILNRLNIKKIKSTNIILKKIITKKNGKKTCGETL